MLTPKIPVAKEGYPFIGAAALVSLILAILDYPIPALIFLVLTFFILYFFRDPERIIPAQDDVLVSPADGRIILVERIFDERFFNEHVHKISIFMNIFNVHVNRIPIGGTIESVTHTPGTFYSADSAKGGLTNENCAVIIQSEIGRKLAVVQVAGLIARRIVCWSEPGDRIGRGMRYGLIRFGSRVDLYIPGTVEITVKKGQVVSAGETQLGRMLP